MKPANATATSTMKAKSWSNVIMGSIKKTHAAPSLDVNLRRSTKVAGLSFREVFVAFAQAR